MAPLAPLSRPPWCHSGVTAYIPIQQSDSRLADLVQLYQSRMEQLGVQLDTRVHSTRLKQRLLAQFPDLREHTKGRE